MNPTTLDPAPVASYRHTAALTAVFALLAVAGLAWGRGPEPGAVVATPPHASLYGSMLLAEAGLFYYVWKAGLRPFGTAVTAITGSLRATNGTAATDVLVAAALWGSWLVTEKLLAILLPGQRTSIDGMLPRGVAESGLWILLSVAAGIAEEFVFRGYLLRQFAALTGSNAAGLILQALVFGVAHGYQGLAACARIVCFGLLFGLVARARGNLRSCMLAHAWTDIVAGLMM